jgi:hypothetical protein
MSTRQTNTVFPIQRPSLTAGVLGQEDQLECLLTKVMLAPLMRMHNAQLTLELQRREWLRYRPSWA